jgi:hypothetical protein
MMGAQTSLNITKSRARSLVYSAMNDEEMLRKLLNVILQDTLYNCYMLVEDGEENDDKELPDL